MAKNYYQSQEFFRRNFMKSTAKASLKKVSLQNGDYFFVNQKPRFQSESSENTDNKSEILIDLSDDEEEKEKTQNTLSRVKSSIFEETLTSEGSDFSSENNSEENSERNEADEEKTKEEKTDKEEPDKGNTGKVCTNVNFSQTNMNARMKESFWKAKEESNTVKESTIFCNYQDKYQFILRFLAVNVKMTFLRYTERRMTDEVCEKFVQPKSTYRYTNYIDPLSSRHLMTKKNHVLVIEKQPSLKIKMPKDRIKRNAKLKFQKSNNPISRLKKSEIKSFLYLTYHSVQFECNPPNLIIESMRHLHDDENRGAGDVVENHKSRGTILIKYKQDLLLFKFDMVKTNLEQILLKTSRATQSKDFDHYIKYFSYPCSKMMHCSIPISTYKYLNPIIKIKYLNKTRTILGKLPLWIKEERRKRLKRFCQLKEMSAARKFELNFLSVIQFHSHFGTLCRIRTGLQKGILLEGDYHYERMALSYQRQKLGIGKKEKERLFMTEVKHGSMEVLDCNLSCNDL